MGLIRISPCLWISRIFSIVVCFSVMYIISDSVPQFTLPQYSTQEEEDSFVVDTPKPDTKNEYIVNQEMDPRNPRVHHSLYDHIYYSSYDGGNVYDNKETTGGATKRRPHHLERQMFKQVLDKVTRYLSLKHNTKYTSDQCKDIRYRNLPTVGMEVDVICVGSQVDRVTLILPQVEANIIFHTRSIPATQTQTPAINIVVPLAGRSDAFQLFLDNLKQVMASHSAVHFGLTVVYFDDGDSNVVKKAMEHTGKSTPNLHTHFLLQPAQKFSRGRALKVGVEESNIKAPVVFLCDADVLFTHSFITRCINTPVQGAQVFYPMVFSQYNPDMVYALHGRRVPQPLQTLHVEDHSGFWRVWGHGMMCLYKSDFVRINGLDPRRTGWGGEDLNLLSKIASMKYKIVRSLDYGLFHHYHPKNCSEAGRGQSWPCAKLRAMGEASSLSFGLWFFRHHYNSSSWGILKEKESWEQRAREEFEDKEMKSLSWKGIDDEGDKIDEDLRKMLKTQKLTTLLMGLLNVFLILCLFWYHVLARKKSDTMGSNAPIL